MRLFHRLPALLVVAALGAGCATAPLDSARREFNSGRLDRADQALASIPEGKDKALVLMERGMIRYVKRDLTGSLADWMEAARVEEQLETHSVSKAAASMLVNDTTLAFRGLPFEQTMLRVFLSRNYLALGQWDDAAVEARHIVRNAERLDGFPDDAYSHYVAGLCFQLSGDDGNASMEFRRSAQLSGMAMDEATGRFVATAGTAAGPFTGHELVCFVDSDGAGATAESAAIILNGKTIGYVHFLANTAQLGWASEQRLAARQTAKAVSRMAVKLSLAEAVAHEDRALGDLLRLFLLSAETPDTRRWKTLPFRLGVARVPCPANLSEFEVVFTGRTGPELARRRITGPFARNGRTFIASCRDNPWD